MTQSVKPRPPKAAALRSLSHRSANRPIADTPDEIVGEHAGGGAPQPPRRLGPVGRAAVGVLMFGALYWVVTEALSHILARLGPALVLSTSRVLLTCIAVAATLLVCRILDAVVWQGIVTRQLGRAPPSLLVDVGRAVVGIAAAVGILATIWDQDVAALLTASSIVFAIIGFALRGVIADAFYGIAIAIERPLTVGDWVRIDNEVTGKVVEITWRAVRLVTTANVAVVVPNGNLASRSFRNFSQPTPVYRENIRIRFDYAVTTHQAERLLLSAVAQVPESANLPERPRARIIEMGDHGVLWELQFWVPDYDRASSVIYAIQRRLLRNLHYAGISVPRAKLETFTESLDRQVAYEHERIANWIQRIDLFETLQPHDANRVMAAARTAVYDKGKVLVKQGEVGDSLFVLQEGTLAVTIRSDDGTERRVGTIAPGGVFGEMSLLTGAPRGATVTAEVDSRACQITRDDIEPLMRSYPQLAEHMSRTLAERQVVNTRAFAAASVTEIAAETQSIAHQIAGRIKAFFRLQH